MMEFRLPQIAPEMEYATITRWLKSAGDAVVAGEPIVEVEAEKVNFEVEAPASGVLESIVAAEGDEVALGATLAVIVENA